MNSFEQDPRPEEINKEVAEIFETQPEEVKLPENVEATAESREVAELKPERALAHEKGTFERFRGKAKEVAGVMMLMTALSAAPALTQKAYAEKRQRPVQVERMHQQNEAQKQYMAQVHEALKEFSDGIANIKIAEWRDRVCAIQEGPKEKNSCEDDFKEVLSIEGRIKDSLREAEIKAYDLDEAGVKHAVLKVSISYMRLKIQTEMLDQKYKDDFRNRFKKWIKDNLR